MEWRTRTERERDLLTHSLADRTAELQLSVNKAEVWHHTYVCGDPIVGKYL